MNNTNTNRTLRKCVLHKWIIVIALCASSILLIAGCDETEQPIDWETKNIQAKIVVDGAITSDTVYQKVVLTLSEDYFVNRPTTKISGATVQVFDGDFTYNFIEPDTSPGAYYSEYPFSGLSNHTYSLSVNLIESVSETKNVSATSIMPYMYSIDTMLAIIYENPFYFGGDEDSLILIVYLEGVTEPNVPYYFLVRVYKNGEPIFNSFSDADIVADGTYSDLDDERALFLSYSEGFLEGDTVGIEIYSITEPFYDFIDALKQLSVPADPFGFSSTMADAVGNINSGKQLGFFYTASISRASTIVEVEDVK